MKEKILRVLAIIHPIFENIILVMMAVITLAIIVTTIIPHLAGLEVGTVKSGSMEPAIPTGSLVYVREQKTDTLKKGDVIMFSIGEMKVIHRAKEINAEERYIITKGDNNRTQDPAAVPFDDVKGKVIFHIPLLGFILEYVKKCSPFLFGVFIFVMLSGSIIWCRVPRLKV